MEGEGETAAFGAVFATWGLVAIAYSAYHIHTRLQRHQGWLNEKARLPAPADNEEISAETYALSLKEVEEALEGVNPALGLSTSLEDVSLKIIREPVVFFAGGRAALLQVAHPFVATGVWQHSAVKQGVAARFYRTFLFMFRMSFGDRDTMLAASRAVRNIHNRVNGQLAEEAEGYPKGSFYSAHNQQAVRWVAATLLDSAVLAYEIMVDSLSDEDKERLMIERKRFLCLFGVPNSSTSFSEFHSHFVSALNGSEKVPSILSVNTHGKKIAEFLFRPPSPLFHGPMELIRNDAAFLLPPGVAKAFGFEPDHLFSYLVFLFRAAVIRVIYRSLPASFRYLSPYLAMERRVGVLRVRWPGKVAEFIAHHALRLVMPDRPDDYDFSTANVLLCKVLQTVSVILTALAILGLTLLALPCALVPSQCSSDPAFIRHGRWVAWGALAASLIVCA